MAEEKRIRRTAEQISADIDEQIEKLRENIDSLEERKAESMQEFDAKIQHVKQRIEKLNEKKKGLATPKKRKPRKKKADKIKEMIAQAQKNGMKLDEIADKLGVDMSE